MSTYYTIAYTDHCLIATVPDGSDVEAAIRAQESDAGVEFARSDVHTASGLTLTDDEPDDEDRIAWKTGKEGFLMDETGRSYAYAVTA